jgi:hypothetical protein
LPSTWQGHSARCNDDEARPDLHDLDLILRHRGERPRLVVDQGHLVEEPRRFDAVEDVIAALEGDRSSGELPGLSWVGRKMTFQPPVALDETRERGGLLGELAGT